MITSVVYYKSCRLRRLIRHNNQAIEKFAAQIVIDNISRQMLSFKKVVKLKKSTGQRVKNVI